MRSVPLALIWELCTHGRLVLLAGACGANLLQFLVFGALYMQGEREFTDPSYLAMQVVFVQINMFLFGSTVVMGQGQLSRLYTYPIPTSTIVTWHLLPAMVLMFVVSLASSAALNAVFGLNWPLWGPALFAAAALAAVVALLWLTEKSAWIVWGMALVGTVLGLWFKSRFGPVFDLPTHQWDTVTPLEMATLFGFTAISYVVAVVAVSRNRRGEPLPELGILAWLGRTFEFGPEFHRVFRSPEQAQLWFEWRKKGWAMPACVIFGLVMGCGGWLIFSREPNELVEGFIGGGGLLSVLGFIGGLILGNCGPNDSSFAMGHFLGTRPLTNSQYSRIILWTAARSVWQTWLIWAIPFAALYLTLVPTGIVRLSPIHNGTIYWFLPATLLGLWTVMTCCAVISLTGRSTLFLEIFLGAFALFIGLNVFSTYALTLEQREEFMRGVFFTAGLAAVFGTAWAYAVSQRRQLISATTTWIAFGIWAATIAAMVLTWVYGPSFPLMSCVPIAGAAALMVAPVAAAPLAIRWNRTR